MKVYIVQRMDKIDYDFSVGLTICGCFTNRSEAIKRARAAYESMCAEYEDEMVRYSDEDVYYDISEGALDVVEDNENGYYSISFGFEDDFEFHNIAVTESNLEMSGMDKVEVHRKYEHDCLIEDIKIRAKEMGINLAEEDFQRLAIYAQRSIDNNAIMWDSYWESIEYALETALTIQN